MEALYAFMRTIDDIADDDSILPGIRRQRLERWRDWRNQDSPIVPALIQTVERYRIPEDCLTETITGVEQDLEFTPLNDWSDLEQYCGRVAGTVGQACVCIWETSPSAAPPSNLAFWAQQQSYAVQLTNILRDIVEDARQGRCYLPATLLAQNGWAVSDFISQTLELSRSAGKLQPMNGGRSHALSESEFLAILQPVIERAGQSYAASAPLQESLTAIGRQSNGLIRRVYGKLFEKIRKNPIQILYTRIRLNWLEKLLAVLG